MRDIGPPAKSAVNSKDRSTASKTAGVAKNGPSTKAGTSKTKTEAASAIVEIPEGQAEYDAGIALTDNVERVAALRKFLVNFPLSTLQTAARESIVTAMVETGNAAIRNRDMIAASAAFVQAAKDAPVPISDQFFSTTLAKLSVNLFFRGEKEAAIIIARVLEGKCVSNSSQLLGIAEFYVSIENGSEAKRLAIAAIEVAPNSSAAYQMLGLASRVNFQLDESASAFAKAVEIDPDSISALRGLAEMRRALGKPDEAVELYRRILAKDEASSSAKTGLILALFENGKRDDAEAAMTETLAANPGNIMLLAGAAYWYAAHNEGQKAIDTAERAISADPRFIWSHIALARGYLAQQMPLSAEKTLLAARRYGNFPTIDYEIASARAMAGLYREAAEELAKSFSVKDGVLSTRLGGQVPRESSDLMELVALERKASIASPQGADSPESARQLTALLDLWTKLNSEKVDPGALGKAADEFVRGDDRMKAHRQLFAAKELLDRKKDLPKVIELARAAVENADAAIDVPSPSAAVMADELYESRRIAILKDEFVTIPDVPRATLLSIIRGRIEDISGWALFQSDNVTESIVRLRRAVSVLPVDSAWWRTSTWRLGSVFESKGQDLDALNAYLKSYKSGQPDAFKYSIIAAVYKRINGSTFGLDSKIGPNPLSPASEISAKKAEPAAIPLVSAANVVPSPERTPEPRPTDAKPDATPDNTSKTISEVSKPEATPLPSPTAALTEATPEPTPAAIRTEPTPAPTPSVEKVESKPETTPAQVRSDPTPEPSPVTVKIEPTPEPSPAAVKVDPTPEPTPTLPVSESVVKLEASKTPEPLITLPSPEPTRTPENSAPATETTKLGTDPDPTRSPGAIDGKAALVTDPTLKTSGSNPEEVKTITVSGSKSPGKDLFPPVIITVAGKDANANTQRPADSKSEDGGLPAETAKQKTPDSDDKRRDESASTAPVQTAAIRPRVVSTASPPQCSLILSENTLSLQNNGGELAVIVRTEDDGDISALTAKSHSPNDVYVRLEPIAGITGRALFIIRSISRRPGIYQVTFALPCGKRDMVVRVH